jgi:hypothetical protein
MTGSAGKIVGIAVIAAVALGAAGCSSSAKTKPHGAKTTGTASASPTGPVSFTLPATVDGLALSKDSSTTDLASATKDDLVALTQDMAGDAVVGSYAGTGKDAAVLIGLPVTVDDVDAQIDAIFDGLRSMDLYAIDDPKPVGTGGAKCADATVLGGADLKLGICVTADTRGTVILMRFTKDATATSTALSSVAAGFER